MLGSGNSGNDASMETVLAYLREAHPDAVVDALCSGPELVRGRYGIDATPLFWYHKFEKRKTGVQATALKILGKGVDSVRIASWVRRHDAVIVPGAGALETTLPQRAWGFPYALLSLTASGRLFGTKVALVSVGADLINNRATGGCLTRPPGSLLTALTGTTTHAMRCGSGALTRRPTGSTRTSSSASRRSHTSPVTRSSSAWA